MPYVPVVPKGSAPPLAPGKAVGVGDAKAQTRFILESIRAVLEAAGDSLNEVYREFFPATPPARYCIRADLVKPELLVEIASIAHL